jgi:beta-phosphoglucomutase-like phosphatase (HAD superfamily)
MIKHIFFDNDGTLVDTEAFAQQTMLQHLSKYGVQIEPEYYHAAYVGLPDREIMQGIKHDFGISLPDHFLSEVHDVLRGSFAKNVQPIAGMTELVSQLKVPRSVISNGKTPYVNQCMNLSGLITLIDGAILGRDLVANPKPAPDLYRLGLTTFDLAPHEAIVVEDSVTGVKAGKAADIFTVGFLATSTHRASHRAQLLAAGADFVAEDAVHLKEFFIGLGLV